MRKYTGNLRNTALRTKSISDEARDELMQNVKVLEENVNAHFRDVQDENVQKYLSSFDEINAKIREISEKIRDISDYSSTVVSWCTGNYDINELF